MNAPHPSCFNPATRGHHAIYREHEINRCPGCGRTQWLIGRAMAECAFCATAMPLESSTTKASRQPVLWTRGRGGGAVR